jgi:hypothetical protein
MIPSKRGVRKAMLWHSRTLAVIKVNIIFIMRLKKGKKMDRVDTSGPDGQHGPNGPHCWNAAQKKGNA